MSIRLLLAVIVAGALIAASMPVIDRAQRTQAEHDLSLAVESIEEASETMVRHSDPVRMGIPPATRRVDVTVPSQPAEAEVSIQPFESGETAGKTILQTAVPGSPPKRTILNTTVRPVRSDGTIAWDESVRVRESTELTLEYRLVDGEPVIAVARGFK